MKNLIIRLFVVIVFLGIAIFFVNYAPDYDIDFKYKNGDLRVILNDKELTRETSKLPEVAVLKNGEIMLSHNTVDILFDKHLYFDDKNDTFITTSDDHIAYLGVGSHTITIDGQTHTISTPVIKTEYNYTDDDRYEEEKKNRTVYYIPIKALEEVYDISVEFNEKLVITSKNIDLSSFVVNTEEAVNIRYLGDEVSKIVDTAKNGDTVYIFNYTPENEYVKVRSKSGELGYVNASVVKKYNINTISTFEEKLQNTENITLAWDYINPISTSIDSMTSRKKISQVDVVAPSVMFFEDSTGEIFYRNNVISDYMKWANNCGYEVWLMLKNDSISDNKKFTIDDLSTFLNDMKSRQKAISQCISICKKFDAQGIDVDIEHIYKKDAEAFSQFIRELSVEAHRQGLKVSVCTNIPDGSEDWSLCYEHKALSEAADYISVMTYDQYGNSSSSAGPNASYDWVQENIEKLVDRDGVESKKILLGIAFYSRLWSVSNGVVSPTTLAMNKAKVYINGAEWSEEAKQYYYESGKSVIWVEDATSIKEKLKLIDEFNLGGSAIWRLGYESDDVWSAFSK